MDQNIVAAPASRFLLPGFGVLLLAYCVLLYLFVPATYKALLEAWMLRPFPHPFIDWEFIPTAAECWAKGINVYVNNTCFAPVANGAMSYSPLWLRLSFLPTSPTGVAAFGLLWAVLFLGSLAYFPPPRGKREIFLMLLTLGSSLTAFALERSNVDVIIFLLTIGGVALLLGRPGLRMLGYALFMLAGLLKYYPLVLLILMLRERPRVFFPLVTAIAAILVVFTVTFWPELVAASKNIPSGSYFTDIFAAKNLPFGLPRLLLAIQAKLGLPALPSAVLAWLPRFVFAILLVTMLAGATWLAFVGGMRPAMRALSFHRRSLLVAGAAMLCGCFFAGPNIGYRGILLLLVLPGLFQLQRLPLRVVAWVASAGAYAIVLVSWVLTVEYVLHLAGVTENYELSGIALLYWVAHEVAWWSIITLLLATLLAFVADSRMIRWTVNLLQLRSVRSATKHASSSAL